MCAVVWCESAAVARGLCKRCYARYKKGISPTPPRRYASNQDKQRLRYEVSQRREAGEGIADIASAVGVSPSTLGRWFREWGVTPDSGRRGQSSAPNQWKPWTADEISLVANRTDLTIAERAAMLGRSIYAIEEALRDQRRRAGDAQH